MSASHTPSIMNKPSWRRYMARLIGAIAVYLAVLLPVDYAARHGLVPGKPWIYLVAIAPVLPVAAMVWAILRYLHEEEDEYERMLNVRAYIAATGMMVTICTGWGFLQDFAGLPTISLHHVFTLFWLCQGAATLWTRLRSRG